MCTQPVYVAYYIVQERSKPSSNALLAKDTRIHEIITDARFNTAEALPTNTPKRKVMGPMSAADYERQANEVKKVWKIAFHDLSQLLVLDILYFSATCGIRSLLV